MQFVIVLGILVLFSVLLAFRALRQLVKMEEVGKVKKELHLGKTLFQKDYSSSEAESSSPS